MKMKAQSKVLAGLVPNDYNMLIPYCSESSINYLKGSLRTLEHGTPPTISFPLYGSRDISVANRFVEEAARKIDVPPFVLEYENKRLEKFAPQGGHPSWEEVQQDFILYKTNPLPVEYLDEEILLEMKKCYSPLKCQVLSATQALSYLKATDKIEERAAGWSEFQLKKTDPLAQRKAMEMINSGNWRHGVGYTFTRLIKQKKRIFMPMPFSSMILQAKYFVPFLTGIQAKLRAGIDPSFNPWAEKIGFEQCFSVMESEVIKADKNDDEYAVYYSLDFEKMDTCTATAQYEKIFIPVMEYAYHGSPAGMKEALLFTTKAPIFSPGGMMVGDHGTASGAEVTNGGETVVNDYVQRRILKLLRQAFGDKVRCVCRRMNGDDSILIFFVSRTIDYQIFVNKLLSIVEQVCRETGLRIQMEKQEVSDTHGFFCQHILWFDFKDGKLHWHYPTSLVLNSIINPQKQYSKKDWDKDYRDIDVIEKLDNAWNHPWYKLLVKFVNDGLKYPLLGADETETKRILSKYERYRQLQSLSERYNRQDYDISKSPTVQEVLSWR